MPHGDDHHIRFWSKAWLDPAGGKAARLEKYWHLAASRTARCSCATEFAGLVQMFHQVQNIRLLGCNTVTTGFAQQTANLTGALVTAVRKKAHFGVAVSDVQTMQVTRIDLTGEIVQLRSE